MKIRALNPTTVIAVIALLYELPSAIAGLQDAIGIEQETIAGGEGRDFSAGVFRIGKDAEHHAMIVFDERGPVASAKQGWRMPCIRDRDGLPVGVHSDHVHRRHICILEMATEDLIHGGEDSGRIVRMIQLR